MKFTLSMPPSINQTYGVGKDSHRLYKRGVVKDWEERAGWEIISQFNKQEHKRLVNDVKVQIIWYYLKDRDIDAGLKVLLDIFQRVGIYVNDSQIKKLEILKYELIGEPRVEVHINEMD